MPSLPQVLHEAANQSASEILIEAGKEPVLVTSDGPVPFSDPLSENDVFDSLGQVLAPEQQAELAVGNVVEFHMDVNGSRWTMLTEPSAAGLVLRGRKHGVAGRVEVGTPMDLPPLEPFQPEKPPPEAPAARRRTARQTRWDLGIPELSEEDEAAARSRTPSRSSQPAWVAEETASAPPAPDPNPGVEAKDDASPPEEEPQEEEPPEDAAAEFELRAPPKGTADDNTVAEDPAEGPSDDDVDLLPPPFAEPELGGPAPDAGEGLGEAPPLPDAPKIVKNTRDVPLATVPGEVATEDEELAQFGGNVGPGSVCLVHGAGAAVRFAGYIDGGAFTVIDGRDLAEVLEAVAEDDPGGTYVIRLDDPSRCLGWMLRRLEEGARIVVETRALTMEGARRTLLGVSASPRAETWLEAHSLHWLSNKDGAWVMQSGARR